MAGWAAKARVRAEAARRWDAGEPPDATVGVAVAYRRRPGGGIDVVVEDVAA